MGTKLKRLSNKSIEKLLLFILTVSFFTGFISSVFQLSQGQDGDFGIIFEKDYFQSSNYLKEVNSIIGTLESLIVDYKSEENIKEGNLLHGEFSLYNQEKDKMFQSFMRKQLKGETEGDYSKEIQGINIREERYLKKFEEECEEDLEKLKQAIISDQIDTYHGLLDELRNYRGIRYTASNGKEMFTNTKSKDPEFYKRLPSYILLDRNGIISKPEQNRNSYLNLGTSILDSSIMNERFVYLGFQNEFLRPRIEEWEIKKTEAMRYPKTIIITFLVTLFGFIRICFLAGRDSDDKTILNMDPIDKLYTDISLLLSFGIIILWVTIINAIYNTGLNDIFKENKIGLDMTFLFITFLFSTIGLYLVLSLVRHIKNKTIFTHSLTYTLFYKIFDFLKSLHEGTSLSKKITFIIIIYPIIILLTFFMFPVTIALVIKRALKKTEEFEKIQEGVVLIKEGDLDYKIDIESNGEFKELADNINDIGSGLKKSVDNELKSERYRSELITNVSHDIRTPLTSIITYIDLLKYEQDENKRMEYVDVLDKKSQRLSQLIDDLFEASKVSSGDIPVNLTDINIVSLVGQGLGELNDRVEEHKLDFITSYESDEMYVKADGELLWRAMENLFSNIFKYSLKGSRVYIDIRSDDGYVEVIMKNISAYKLNITEEELMERFKRGDESRTSEGSGLGLSIAESLLDVQKGKFEIEIDGDLFKTRIRLPKSEKEKIELIG